MPVIRPHRWCTRLFARNCALFCVFLNLAFVAEKQVKHQVCVPKFHKGVSSKVKKWCQKTFRVVNDRDKVTVRFHEGQHPGIGIW